MNEEDLTIEETNTYGKEQSPENKKNGAYDGQEENHPHWKACPDCGERIYEIQVTPHKCEDE